MCRRFNPGPHHKQNEAVITKCCSCFFLWVEQITVHSNCQHRQVLYIKVVSKLLEVIKPEGSTLVIARDLVYKAGVNAPMVTDDWWLDVVEYSGREYLWHEYLAFNIPFNTWEPRDRGEYIARHALQKLWQEEGEDRLISQLTPPNDVLDFIETQPGLKDVAMEQPQKIAFFFPQLTIPGFGGYDKGELASIYFTGNGGGIGPSSSRHDQIDFIIWLLSSCSSWLPSKIRNELLVV